MKTYTIALKVKNGNSIRTTFRQIESNDKTLAVCKAMTAVEETLKDNELILAARVASVEF